MNNQIRGDVFLEPVEHEFLVYAPKHNLAFIVDKTGAEFIHRLKTQRVDRIPPECRALHQHLASLGLLDAEPSMPTPDSDLFNPTQVMLLLTANCNLRCTYCFSRGGENRTNLPLDVAKSAIDLVVSNAKARNEATRVHFHGGGEPTLCWETLTACTGHLRAVARDAAVSCRTKINTNGAMSIEKVRWVAENIDSIVISLDGPQRAHDQQRPMAGGGGSFDRVHATMVELSRLGKEFSVRATITSENVKTMPDLINELSRMRVTGVEFEPLTRCGRANDTGIVGPSADDYISAYVEADRRARFLGIRTIFSGVRLGGISSVYCGAAGRNFAVTPHGAATLCHRVSDPDDAMAKVFHYGAYSEDEGTFKFDSSRIKQMAGLHCEQAKACVDCFAKWNCSGGCYAQNIADSGALLLETRNEKCQITRELTKRSLARSIELKTSV